MIDRRLDERVSNSESGIARATLRPGCPVAIVDVSPGGALVQGGRPLRPGARVHLHLVTPRETLTLPACVLRCVVWSIGGEGMDGVIYRGALQFERRCEELQVGRPDCIQR